MLIDILVTYHTPVLGVLPLIPLIGWGIGLVTAGSAVVAVNNLTEQPTTVENNYYGTEAIELVADKKPWYSSFLPSFSLLNLTKYIPLAIVGYFGWQWWQKKKKEAK
ncbi:MAG: hypothetical protein NE327_06370 [Lentisphaeraceae bacterium]|nr:hypothetical protein [Lentisphaeraceae bacterium]